MKHEYVISDELFNELQSELVKGNRWFAFNEGMYFLDKGDVIAFQHEAEARQYSFDNHSDLDSIRVITAHSIISLMRQLPYGEDIHFNLTQQELEELFKSFDWSKAIYDPLHDVIEATTEQDKEELSKMETLLVEWENLYNRNPEAALQLAVTYWEGQPMEQYKNDFITIKNDLMKSNLEHLSDKVRNHGFGETMGPEIEAMLQKGQTEFTIAHKTEVNKKEIEATLYFGKSEKSDLYFFNRYDCRMKNEKDETLAQTFYINNGWGVTLKEAYNLLNGRAVHKELTNKEDQKYKAWIQLDFSAKDKHGNYERKQFHENYGYDIKEALSYYFIKEMVKEKDMEALIKSLEKGNVQMVTVTANGNDVKLFIEANPQYKSINVYDNRMNRLNQEKREELMSKPEMRQEKSQGQKQSLGVEDKDEKKQGRGRKKSDDLEDKGLVQRKNNNKHNRGMGVH